MHILLIGLLTDPDYVLVIYVPFSVVSMMAVILSALGIKAFWR